MDMKRFNQLFALLLLPVDYLAVWSSFLVAYAIRLHLTETQSLPTVPYGEYVGFASWAALIWIPIFFSFGLYRFRGFRNWWELFAKVIGATSLAVLVLTLILYLSKNTFDSRLMLMIFWGVSVFMVLIGRGLLNYIKMGLNYQGIGVEKVVIIADTDTQALIEQQVKRTGPGQKLIAKLQAFSHEALHDLRPNRLILGSILDRTEMIPIMRYCEDNGIILNYIPSLVETYRTHSEVDMVMGYPVIEISSTPLVGWGRVAKRAFDLLVGGLALIILSPVMLAVAIAVRLDSKGPIIFAQPRVGERGKLFTFYKFRSMFAELSTGDQFGGAAAQILLDKLRAEYNEADGPLFKIAEDPRITKVGKFIRATSLDELPQLFNVILGNMSLVGPRPALPEEVAQYEDQAKRRLLIKPGVTGMWQVSGRNDVTFAEYVRLDTFYVEHWSLWLDIKIILLTGLAILKRTGK